MPTKTPSGKGSKARSAPTTTPAKKAKVTPKKTPTAKTKPSAAKKSTAIPAKGKGAIATNELKVGNRAPAFSLPNEKGQVVKLSELKGKKIVLFFYPKDDTPGCTKESCAFNENLTSLNKMNTAVIGLSKCSVKKHDKLD